jgi:acetyl-CoA C-acetyltransferase
MTKPFGLCYSDIWLLEGARTGFADYNGVLGDVSPTDLGITVARAVLDRAGLAPEAVDAVVAANVAQSSFDAYYLARQIGLYAGLPIERPAHMVHRLCGSGFDAILQAADAITLGKADTMLCVGTESMSRNPVAAYTHRGGFRMGQIEFADFLWESTLDTSSNTRMGDTAENLAKRYAIPREEVDLFAAHSFERALASHDFRAGEIVAVEPTTFECPGYRPRPVRLPKGVARFADDDHVRPTPLDVLARLKPAFGGVQTGGNSSAIVDGAAGCLVGRGRGATGGRALARVVAGVAVGVPPEIMGIGPAPAIRALLSMTGLDLSDIGRFEINEAFGAQYLAVEQELGLDRARVNVNGGAIALGHPLGASGTRLTLTLARTLKRDGLRYGIASACAGGGQGVAILLENQEAA